MELQGDAEVEVQDGGLSGGQGIWEGGEQGGVPVAGHAVAAFEEQGFGLLSLGIERGWG